MEQKIYCRNPGTAEALCALMVSGVAGVVSVICGLDAGGDYVRIQWAL